MNSLFDALREGGPLMFPLLCLSPMFGMVGLLRIVLGVRRRFFGLGFASVTLLLGIGLAGTHTGLQQAFMAVAYATPDMRAALLMRGQELALITTWTGLLLAVLAGLPHLAALAREGLPPFRASMIVLGGLMGLTALGLLLSIGALAATLGSMPTTATTSEGPEEITALAQRIDLLLGLGIGTSALTVVSAMLLGLVASVVGAVWGKKAVAQP